MRIKPIHVLDDGTDVWFLVGKFDESDAEWARWAGWGFNDVRPTLILKPRASMTSAAISDWDCPPVDIEEKLGSLDGTVLGLVNAVKGLSFEALPELVDLR